MFRRNFYSVIFPTMEKIGGIVLEKSRYIPKAPCKKSIKLETISNSDNIKLNRPLV